MTVFGGCIFYEFQSDSFFIGQAQSGAERYIAAADRVGAFL